MRDERVAQIVNARSLAAALGLKSRAADHPSQELIELAVAVALAPPRRPPQWRIGPARRAHGVSRREIARELPRRPWAPAATALF